MNQIYIIRLSDTERLQLKQLVLEFPTELSPRADLAAAHNRLGLSAKHVEFWAE